MSKHTPGPWSLRYTDDVGFYPVVQRGRSGGFEVRDSGKGRALADARLIAAAPELLEALVNMVEWHGKREWPTAEFKVESLLPIDLQNDEVRLAMRAIAKATGEA